MLVATATATMLCAGLKGAYAGVKGTPLVAEGTVGVGDVALSATEGEWRVLVTWMF